MVVKAIHDSLKHLKEVGIPADLTPRQESIEQLRATVGTGEFETWQWEFLKE